MVYCLVSQMVRAALDHLLRQFRRHPRRRQETNRRRLIEGAPCLQCPLDCFGGAVVFPALRAIHLDYPQ